MRICLCLCYSKQSRSFYIEERLHDCMKLEMKLNFITGARPVLGKTLNVAKLR